MLVIVFPLKVYAPFRTEPPCGGAAAQLNRTAHRRCSYAALLRAITERS
jgi:hypothetical protein